MASPSVPRPAQPLSSMSANTHHTHTHTTTPGQVANTTAPAVPELKQARSHHFYSTQRFLAPEDIRARLPRIVSRFLGWRDPAQKPPYDPLPFPPFSWLTHIPLRVEVWLFAWLGAFGGILLIEAIMSANTAFREVYASPIIITSFGASAVLLFGVIEAPLAQPRNFVGGHFVSALVGVCITRLFVLDPRYQPALDNTAFHGNTFVNGGLSMATSLLAMLVLGCVHPPAGATGLNAAVQADIVTLSWRYLPVILASSLIMLGWALIINNLGRRRYPIYWFSPTRVLVRPQAPHQSNDEEKALRTLQEIPSRVVEDGGRNSEALLEQRLAGEGVLGSVSGLEDEDEDDNTQDDRGDTLGFRVGPNRAMSPGDRRRVSGGAN